MRRILVVDDDPQTRAAIGLWLRHCGFRVAITDGGASGLAALAVRLWTMRPPFAILKGFEFIF